MLSDGNWPNASSLVHTPWFARPVMGGVEDVTSTSTTSHRTRSSSVRSNGGGGRLSPRIIITSNCPQGRGEDIGQPLLPLDPRHWDREDVRQWVLYMASRHNLPEIHTDRFLMNGKALCLMSVAMFTYRVPLGGKLLYKDFQLRLSKAMYNEETSSSSSAATTNSSSLQHSSSSHHHHHRPHHHHRAHNRHGSPHGGGGGLPSSLNNYDRPLLQSNEYNNPPGSKAMR
eukprot:TRINITY_DN2861_c0_g2_i2.p1 TRINITY_DN2861_c0_g2~~TRINITY_DN2861_c0_g2_i2.p1  ORF type:complete len:228 (-),score=66.89 TRINITY_DN2861_c0_g2_i2:1637-2320(-)